MNNEYVIINRTKIEKRIKELEQISPLDRLCFEGEIEVEEKTLKQILSESTPLIPVIEKAIEYGILEGSGAELHEITDEVTEHQQDYISNLKLDI